MQIKHIGRHFSKNAGFVKHRINTPIGIGYVYHTKIGCNKFIKILVKYKR